MINLQISMRSSYFKAWGSVRARSLSSIPAQFKFHPIQKFARQFTMHAANQDTRTMTDDDFEYNWIDGVEELARYTPGGYHPVMLGDELNGRYRIIDKLGFGGFSTVWLAQDSIRKQYVALKVCTADSSSSEPKVLDQLCSVASTHPGSRTIRPILDKFEIDGINGRHLCYTSQLASGSVRDAGWCRLFSLPVARALSVGLTLGIAYVHSRGFIHGDVHLGNVLVGMPPEFNRLSIEQLQKEHGEPGTRPVTERTQRPLPRNVPARVVIPVFLGKYAQRMSLADVDVLLSDFGEVSSRDHPRLGEESGIPFPMRAPELRFRPTDPLTTSTDMWSLAIALWQIVGMKGIFYSSFVTDDEMVGFQIDVLGFDGFPREWWDSWTERGKFFDAQGRRLEAELLGEIPQPGLEQTFENFVQEYRRKREGVEPMDKDEAAAFLKLMRSMLRFRPEERLSAQEVLESEWMTQWAMPAFEAGVKLRSHPQ